MVPPAEELVKTGSAVTPITVPFGTRIPLRTTFVIVTVVVVCPSANNCAGVADTTAEVGKAVRLVPAANSVLKLLENVI